MSNENKSEQHSFSHNQGSTFIPARDHSKDGQKENDLSEKLKQDLDKLALKIKILYGKKP